MPRRTRPTTVHPGAVREAHIVRIDDVTASLRRVTLGGDQLGAFSPVAGVLLPEVASTGFDDDIMVLLPYPGETEPVLPYFAGGSWHQPTDRRPLGRHYTVRRWDPVKRELDIDFVRHGLGVAATWAYRAQVGDRVHIGGPSVSRGLPDGFDWLLVVADETAAPAVARLLDQLPVGSRAQVFIEVPDATHHQALREIDGVEVMWLTTGGMVDAVRDVVWWEGSVFAWVAGEQSMVRDVRRHLVNDREVPKTDVDFVGYWKRAAAVASSDDPSVPDLEQEDRASELFHHKSELLPPLAVRLAIKLGLGELIASGVGTPAELAAHTGTVEGALCKFLRYLEAIELLASEDGVYRLTPAGDELADERTIEMLRPDGVFAQLEKGFFGLAESLETGGAAFSSVTGRSFEAMRDEADFGSAYFDMLAEDADYLASSLADAEALRGAEHVVLYADAAGAIAAALVEAHPAMRVTIVADDRQAAWLAADLPQTLAVGADRVAVVATNESAGATILMVNRLALHPDVDAAELLRSRAADGELLVFEETLDELDVEDHDAEADLLYLAVHGSGYRSDAEVDALIIAAGMTTVASESAYWADRLRTVRCQSPE